MSRFVLRALLTGTAAAASIGAAHAQSGTPAGTTVSNQATATYSVNGTPASVQSNVSTFKVDRKVDLTLVAQTGTTKVNLGQNAAYLSFTLTNKTNGTQDFILNPSQQIVSLPGLLGTDNFDAGNLTAYVDKNGNGTYEPGTDDQTYVDELPADGSVAVFLVGDIPNQNGAAFASASMQAVVARGGTTGTRGTVLAETLLDVVDDPNAEDVVFADNDSDGLSAGDLARNGAARAYAQFEIGTRAVDLSILKSSRVISDGVNLVGPKALPGATVEYCLLVRNATLLTPATGVALADTLPAQTTYVDGSLKIGGATCLLGGEAQDDDADDASDNRIYSGAYNPATRVITANMPTVAGGGQLAATFQVKIN